MKKYFNCLLTAFILFITIFLTSCPGFLTDDIKKYTCLSAQELTDYMNSLGFDSTFTLKDSTYTEKKDYKCIEVYLEADKLPGKTVYAFQSYSYGRRATDSARTTIMTVQDYRYTDYYYVKYEAEILATVENLYKPVIENFEKNKTCKIAIKPDSL